MAVGGQYTVQLRAILDTKGVLAQIAQIQKQAGKVLIGGAGAGKGASGIAAVGKEANRTAAGVKRLNAAVDTTGKTVKRVEGRRLANAYTNVGKSAKQASSSVKQASTNVKGFGATTLDVTKKVIQFGAVTAAIRGVTAGMGSMVQQTFQLDSALTEFKKVSDLSGKGLEKYTKQAYDAGKQTAKTGVEMIEAATQFKKMGYSEQTSMQLATTATMFQNIADAEISAGDAAKFINSQMKAFQGEFSKYNTEGERAQKVIDSVNEVANNYAVGTNDLQLALTKTSAAMGTFGNSFDQTLGIMTAGTEIMVGMPSQVARGWRTIAANISKAGEQNRVWADSSGEVNIQMRKQNGEIKNTYEFLTDLYNGQKGVSKGWNDLNKDQKTAIALQLAGKNNQEKFLAVMNNFETAIKATETAENSHNSALRENARYLDSIEGRVQALKSAWSRFSNQIVKSDTVKKTISGLTKGIDLLASDGGSAFLKVAAGATSLVFASKGLNAVFGTKGVISKGFSKIAKGGVQAGKGMTAATKATTTAAKAGGRSAKAFGLLRGAFAGGAVGWGILGAAGVAYGIYKLNKYLTEKYDPDNIYAKTKQDLDKYTGSLKRNEKEQEKLEKKQKKGTATESDDRRLRQLKREERVIKRQVELQKKVEATAYGNKQRKIDKGVEKTDRYKEAYQKNRAKFQTASPQQIDAITKKEIGATDRLSSKYVKWADSIDKVSKAKKESQDAQKALEKAEKSNDPQKLQKALQAVDKAYEDEVKALAGVTDGYVAMADKRDAILNKFGSEDKIPSYLKDSYNQLDKVVGAMEHLQGMESFEKLGGKELQGVIKDFKALGTDAGIAVDKAGKINNINYDQFMATMEAAGFMSEEVMAQLKLIGESNPEATVTIEGTEVAIEDIDTVTEYLDKVASGDPKATIKIDGKEVAVKDIKSVDDLVDKLTKGEKEIKLDSDNKPAKKKIKETEKQGKKYSKKKYKNKLDSDNKPAKKKIKETEKQGKKYGKKKYKAKLDSDPRGAKKGAKEATAAVETLDGKEAIAWLKEHGGEAVEARVNEVGQVVLSMPDGKTVTITETGAKQGEKNVGSLDKSIGKVKGKNVSVNASTSGKGNITSLQSAINSVKGKSVTVKVNYQSTGERPKAKGGKAKFGGLTEVNEEGWEFIRDAKTGQLRIAGGGQRTVTVLNKGDEVYTHRESKRMVASGESDLRIPQHKKGKKGKSSSKKKKAQEAYNKAYEKRKTSYENAVKTIEYNADLYHWADTTKAKKIQDSYNKHIKALKKWNNSKAVKKWKKAGAKVKASFGTDLYREQKLGKEEAAHDARLEKIEKDIASLGLGKSDPYMSTKEADSKVSSLKSMYNKRQISWKEYEEYRAEIYKAYIDSAMKMYKAGRKTYKNMKADLDSYVKSGKITWAEYYEYIEDLMEEQLDKEKEALEKKQEKNQNTYDLGKAYVQRQIDLLEKQNKEQEEQNELVEKQSNLEKARSQKVKVYRQGVGFVYEQDTEAVREATQALQEYKKEQDSPELKAWKEVLDLFDDLEAQAEIKDLENKVGSTVAQLFGSFGTNVSQWTTWAKDKLATNLGYENILTEMEGLQGWEAIQAYLNANGNVDTSKITSAINKNRFATGTLSAPAGFARVAENGYEIALLGKGDSVMPHEVSENLMAWGQYTPLDVSKSTTGDDIANYHFDKLVLPNVTNAEQFLHELNNLPNRAIQNSWRRG